MCGIAGCYQQADGQKLVDVMTDRIAHRGPDATGTWSHEDSRVSMHLGHRRLSIIDLSTAADQPLTKDGLTLVYNGELYNYKELRAELKARGVRFVTASDTEVVLEAWRAWGPAALRRFRGMFAFALADEATGELVLARDPLGIKPLYYLPRGDGLLFASELKALVAAVGTELRIEPGALVASMLYYWVPEQRCAIEGVRKLPPGSWARIRPDGKLSVQQYWQIADVARGGRGGPAEPADLRAVIEESVAAHLVADVPVSSFLSGGLDSSIVTVLAHQASQAIDAYTITFRPEDQRLEAMPDDAVYARKVAAQFGIKLHEIEISPDIVEPAAPHGRRARRADRRPGRDQHAAHVRGRARARRQGHPVRHGRRRAVRRLPQAPGLRHGQPVQQAARACPGPACGPRWTGSRSAWAAAACATPGGPSAS